MRFTLDSGFQVLTVEPDCSFPGVLGCVGSVTLSCVVKKAMWGAVVGFDVKGFFVFCQGFFESVYVHFCYGHVGACIVAQYGTIDVFD